MNTNQREPEGDTAPLLTLNIEVHHHGKSARYCRASRAAQHAFCCTSSAQHLTSLSLHGSAVGQGAHTAQETDRLGDSALHGIEAQTTISAH